MKSKQQEWHHDLLAVGMLGLWIIALSLLVYMTLRDGYGWFQ